MRKLQFNKDHAATFIYLTVVFTLFGVNVIARGWQEAITLFVGIIVIGIVFVVLLWAATNAFGGRKKS